MIRHVSRREFLKSAGAVAAAAFAAGACASFAKDAAAAPKKRWFKGNMHMHNQWSDGKPLPEWAVDWYKSHGYHFICQSDHNIFQSDRLRFDGFNFDNSPADCSAFKNETSLWKPISAEPGWSKLTQVEVDRRTRTGW